MTNKFDRIHTNTNKKYVIRNCPYYSEDETLDGYENMTDCQNITDCLLKQIVELCKRDKNFCINCKSKADSNIDCVECIEGGRAQLAQDILQLLQIEEVE